MGLKQGVITSGTTVRYVGSIEEFRGLYGWVVASKAVNPAAVLLGLAEKVEDLSPLVRYSVRLSRKPSEGGEVRLDNVRHESLVVGPNKG